MNKKSQDNLTLDLNLDKRKKKRPETGGAIIPSEDLSVMTKRREEEKRLVDKKNEKSQAQDKVRSWFLSGVLEKAGVGVMKIFNKLKEWTKSPAEVHQAIAEEVSEKVEPITIADNIEQASRKIEEIRQNLDVVVNAQSKAMSEVIDNIGQIMSGKKYEAEVAKMPEKVAEIRAEAWDQRDKFIAGDVELGVDGLRDKIKLYVLDEKDRMDAVLYADQIQAQVEYIDRIEDLNQRVHELLSTHQAEELVAQSNIEVNQLAAELGGLENDRTALGADFRLPREILCTINKLKKVITNLQGNKLQLVLEDDAGLHDFELNCAQTQQKIIASASKQIGSRYDIKLPQPDVSEWKFVQAETQEAVDLARSLGFPELLDFVKKNFVGTPERQGLAPGVKEAQVMGWAIIKIDSPTQYIELKQSLQVFKKKLADSENFDKMLKAKTPEELDVEAKISQLEKSEDGVSKALENLNRFSNIKKIHSELVKLLGGTGQVEDVAGFQTKVLDLQNRLALEMRLDEKFINPKHLDYVFSQEKKNSGDVAKLVYDKVRTLIDQLMPVKKIGHEEFKIDDLAYHQLKELLELIKAKGIGLDADSRRLIKLIDAHQTGCGDIGKIRAAMDDVIKACQPPAEPGPVSGGTVVQSIVNLENIPGRKILLDENEDFTGRIDEIIYLNERVIYDRRASQQRVVDDLARYGAQLDLKKTIGSEAFDQSFRAGGNVFYSLERERNKIKQAKNERLLGESYLEFNNIKIEKKDPKLEEMKRVSDSVMDRNIQAKCAINAYGELSDENQAMVETRFDLAMSALRENTNGWLADMQNGSIQNMSSRDMFLQFDNLYDQIALPIRQRVINEEVDLAPDANVLARLADAKREIEFKITYFCGLKPNKAGGGLINVKNFADTFLIDFNHADTGHMKISQDIKANWSADNPMVKLGGAERYISQLQVMINEIHNYFDNYKPQIELEDNQQLAVDKIDVCLKAMQQQLGLILQMFDQRIEDVEGNTWIERLDQTEFNKFINGVNASEKGKKGRKLWMFGAASGAMIVGTSAVRLFGSILPSAQGVLEIGHDIADEIGGYDTDHDDTDHDDTDHDDTGHDHELTTEELAQQDFLRDLPEKYHIPENATFGDFADFAEQVNKVAEQRIVKLVHIAMEKGGENGGPVSLLAMKLAGVTLDFELAGICGNDPFTDGNAEIMFNTTPEDYVHGLKETWHAENKAGLETMRALAVDADGEAAWTLDEDAEAGVLAMSDYMSLYLGPSGLAETKDLDTFIDKFFLIMTGCKEVGSGDEAHLEQVRETPFSKFFAQRLGEDGKGNLYDAYKHIQADSSGMLSEFFKVFQETMKVGDEGFAKTYHERGTAEKANMLEILKLLWEGMEEPEREAIIGKPGEMRTGEGPDSKLIEFDKEPEREAIIGKPGEMRTGEGPDSKLIEGNEPIEFSFNAEIAKNVISAIKNVSRPAEAMEMQEAGGHLQEVIFDRAADEIDQVKQDFVEFVDSLHWIGIPTEGMDPDQAFISTKDGQTLTFVDFLQNPDRSNVDRIGLQTDHGVVEYSWDEQNGELHVGYRGVSGPGGTDLEQSSVQFKLDVEPAGTQGRSNANLTYELPGIGPIQVSMKNVDNMNINKIVSAQELGSDWIDSETGHFKEGINWAQEGWDLGNKLYQGFNGGIGEAKVHLPDLSGEGGKGMDITFGQIQKQGGEVEFGVIDASGELRLADNLSASFDKLHVEGLEVEADELRPDIFSQIKVKALDKVEAANGKINFGDAFMAEFSQLSFDQQKLIVDDLGLQVDHFGQLLTDFDARLDQESGEFVLKFNTWSGSEGFEFRVDSSEGSLTDLYNSVQDKLASGEINTAQDFLNAFPGTIKVDTEQILKMVSFEKGSGLDNAHEMLKDYYETYVKSEHAGLQKIEISTQDLGDIIEAVKNGTLSEDHEALNKLCKTLTGSQAKHVLTSMGKQLVTSMHGRNQDLINKLMDFSHGEDINITAKAELGEEFVTANTVSHFNEFAFGLAKQNLLGVEGLSGAFDAGYMKADIVASTGLKPGAGNAPELHGSIEGFTFGGAVDFETHTDAGTFNIGGSFETVYLTQIEQMAKDLIAQGQLGDAKVIIPMNLEAKDIEGKGVFGTNLVPVYAAINLRYETGDAGSGLGQIKVSVDILGSPDFSSDDLEKIGIKPAVAVGIEHLKQIFGQDVKTAIQYKPDGSVALKVGLNEEGGGRIGGSISATALKGATAANRQADLGLFNMGSVDLQTQLRLNLMQGDKKGSGVDAIFEAGARLDKHGLDPTVFKAGLRLNF